MTRVFCPSFVNVVTEFHNIACKHRICWENAFLPRTGELGGENVEGGFNANMMTQEQMEQYIAMQQKYMEMYQQMTVTSQQGGSSVDGNLSATTSSSGIDLSSMTNMTSGDMTAFAQQFRPHNLF